MKQKLCNFEFIANLKSRDNTTENLIEFRLKIKMSGSCLENLTNDFDEKYLFISMKRI